MSSQVTHYGAQAQYEQSMSKYQEEVEESTSYHFLNLIPVTAMTEQTQQAPTMEVRQDNHIICIHLQALM